MGSKNTFPLSNNTRDALLMKKKFWKKYKLSGFYHHKLLCNMYTKLCKKLVFMDRLKYENNLAQNANCKPFYKFVKSTLKRNTSVPTLIDSNGAKVLEDVEKCGLLNSFFSSVFTDDDNIMPDFPARCINKLEDIVFSPRLVLDALKNLSNSYASGPDGFPAIFFRKISHCICEPLSTMYNIIFASRNIPNDWLLANVIPIFKQKGSASKPGSYRPISLTCVACKVMESCVKEKINTHLSVNELLSPHQHGFLSKRSTQTELLEN